MISAERFQQLRPYLFSVAYRMLGSATEAEDVLQDAWLRASAAPGETRSDRPWLTTVVTRLCLDRLKSARASRERYTGIWLPEPVPTAGAPGPEETMLRRESITLAFLVILETLTPAERAAFVLREVFDYGYGEIATILDASEAACRQWVHRAAERLRDRRSRFCSDPARQREIVKRFLSAVERGDLAGLQEVLSRDVVSMADGGGKAAAGLNALCGPEVVGKLFVGVWRRRAAVQANYRLEWSEANGECALLAFVEKRLDTVFVFSTDSERITRIHVLRNPDKLAWFAAHNATRPQTLDISTPGKSGRTFGEAG
jgi:RNA polymerase sigma-70 factor (ECF subfamily)